MPDLVTLGVITKWAITGAIALTVPPRILMSYLALLIRYQHEVLLAATRLPWVRLECPIIKSGKTFEERPQIAITGGLDQQVAT